MLSEQKWMLDFNCLILLLHKTPAEELHVSVHREEHVWLPCMAHKVRA